MNTANALRGIYNHFRNKYRSNLGSDQMCCMWSISNPPNDIYNSEQILRIENEFDIEISEEDAYAIYDMDFSDAVEKINAIKMTQC